MESKSKIKLKPESIKKNMFIKITHKDNKVTEGYFKKFMYKNILITEPKKQGQYRDTLDDIYKDFQGVKQEQIYLFLTSSETDDKSQFAKMYSVQIKDIEEIRLVTPQTIEPFVRILQMQIDEMAGQIKALQQQIQILNQQQQKDSLIIKQRSSSKKSRSKSKTKKYNYDSRDKSLSSVH